MTRLEECAQLDERGRPWIQTASGHPFPIGDPAESDFKIADIGHHLSRLNRYTGAIALEHYSVAEHSVRVAYYLRALLARELELSSGPVLTSAFRAGLMHDAHEAYLNDLNSPLKRYLSSVNSPEYHDLSERYDVKLKKRYRWGSWVLSGMDFVREADLAVLDLERPNVLGPPPRPWNNLHSMPMVDHTPPCRWGLSPNDARGLFYRAALECGAVDP